MTGIRYLACLWTLFITRTGFVCCDIQFLERFEGESVSLPCVVEPRNPSPYGVYLKRSWLQSSEVLFMYTNNDIAVNNEADKSRISASGDPSSHSLNVTISQLSVGDTDRYHCEFLVANPSSADDEIRGKTEFFLLVNADVPDSVDIRLVETCPGGSVVLPCHPPHGEAAAVEGVSLKRQKGRAPVELLYHSKRHHGSSPPSSSQFPAERVQLSSAPGPRGIAYNLSLQQLQSHDSALYSCHLLLQGRPDSSTSLGRRVVFVSVQGGQCSCANYSTLLYALSSTVVVLLLLFLGSVAILKGKAHRSVKSHPQPPIYEEMTVVRPSGQKLAPYHLEETESSEYRNCSVKKTCAENHYESPSGALSPSSEYQK